MTSGLRTTTSFLLGLVGCVLLVGALVTVWGKTQVLDTDRFVTTISPVAQDPAVRDRVSELVSAALLDQADSAGLPDSLQSSLADAVRSQTDAFARSKAFVQLWARTNRLLQSQTVDLLLTGRSQAAVVRRGYLVVDLTEVVDAVRTQVLNDVPGLDQLPDAADALPSVDLQVPLASAGEVKRVGSGARAVDRWAYPLAAVVLVALVLSLVAARRRSRALAWFGIGAAVAAAVTWAAARAGQSVVVARLPSTTAGEDVSAAYVGALVGSLRHDAVVVGVVALALALVGAVSAGVAGRRRSA